ncbi:MAG: hypothetical protein V3V49_08680 [Candidatus Krumholzibacteria bacterium]
MFFGFWNSARANKENILYAIVTVLLFERVRTGWNKLASSGRRDGLPVERVEKRQRRLVVKASLLYALPLLLPVIKYIYRSIEELAWSVPGLLVLKSTWAFWGLLLVTECFLALVLYHLLKIYVERMNVAIGFFKAMGRNVVDGFRPAVQVSTTVGTRTVAGVRKLSTSARATLTTGAALGRGVLHRASKAVTSWRWTRRVARGADGLEGSCS